MIYKILKNVVDDSIKNWGNSEQWYHAYKNSSQISFIEMPISPTKIWICAPRDFKFDDKTIKLLVSSFNMRLMMVRPKYVYSLNPIKDLCCFKYSKALNTFL